MGCKLVRMSCAGASAGMQQAVHCEQTGASGYGSCLECTCGRRDHHRCNDQQADCQALLPAADRTCVRHRLGDQAPSAAASSSTYPSSSHSLSRPLPPILRW